jgi:hypothetical protein
MMLGTLSWLSFLLGRLRKGTSKKIRLFIDNDRGVCRKAERPCSTTQESIISPLSCSYGSTPYLGVGWLPITLDSNFLDSRLSAVWEKIYWTVTHVHRRANTGSRTGSRIDNITSGVSSWWASPAAMNLCNQTNPGCVFTLSAASLTGQTTRFTRRMSGHRCLYQWWNTTAISHSDTTP